VCAHITWAIVDNGQLFFGHNPMDFLVSYLEGVTDAIQNANPIQGATFPRKWLSLSTLDPPYSVPPVGSPPTHWGNPPTAMAQAPASASCLAPSTPKENT
jgi:hypothetical protein